jgi:hypothetical protein
VSSANYILPHWVNELAGGQQKVHRIEIRNRVEGRDNDLILSEESLPWQRIVLASHSNGLPEEQGVQDVRINA